MADKAKRKGGGRLNRSETVKADKSSGPSWDEYDPQFDIMANWNILDMLDHDDDIVSSSRWCLMAKAFLKLTRLAMRKLLPGETLMEHGMTFERLANGAGGAPSISWSTDSACTV